MSDARTGRVFPALIIGVGVGLRLTQYLGNRSFWGDEVAVALNLRFRTFTGLLHPLNYDQTMPLGLVLVIKCLTMLWGYSELVLRLPLLLAGCGLLILTWTLFSKTFEHRIVFLVVALMAVSQPLIYYSAELKQYQLDALVTVLLVYLAVATLTTSMNHAWPKLIACGSVAMFFSQPVVFVLASIGIAAVLDRRFRSSGTWRKYCVIAAAVWLGIFGVLLWFSYRPTMHSAYMRAFWSTSFINPRSLHFRASLSTSLDLLLGSFHIVHVRLIILGLLFLVGLYGIWKKSNGLIAVIAAGPFGLVLLAATLQQYPIATRLLMFTVPILLLIYATGISLIADFIPPRFSNLAFIALSCFFILPTVIETGRQAIHFNPREATRDIVRTIKTGNPEASVYLVFGRYKEWAYYAADWSQPELLKQRVDLEYACVTQAQVGYIVGSDERAGGCVDLHFSPIGRGIEEIIGNPQPAPSMGAQVEGVWVEKEALRIASVRTKRVWLFLPIYTSNAQTGFPKQRKLLEKLEAQIENLGCRSDEMISKGDSLAHRFECGDKTK